MKFKFLKNVIGGLILVVSSVANAGLISSPISVLNNTLGNFSSTYDLIYTINQTGLSSSFSSGITDFDTYISTNPLHQADSLSGGTNAWFAQRGNVTGTIDFDLGSVFFLNQLALWNDDNHGISSMTIFTSQNSTFSSLTNVGNFNPVSLNGPLSAQVFDLIDSSAQFVRLSINGSHGSLVGFGEIAFDTNKTDVPEPSTLAIFALGMIGLASRRFKKQS